MKYILCDVKRTNFVSVLPSCSSLNPGNFYLTVKPETAFQFVFSDLNEQVLNYASDRNFVFTKVTDFFKEVV